MINSLHFLTAPATVNTLLIGSYNPTLVAISIIIAIFSSYTALQVCEQVKLLEQRQWRFNWLSIGAVALGVGIWAMHFIGMLAFHLPCHIHYNSLVTLISMIPSILASGVALYLCSRRNISAVQLISGGILVGGGIGIMHYTGMGAMRMNADLFYDLKLFLLSIFVAVLLAIVALWIKFGLTQFSQISNWVNSLSAVVMGAAISGMHYTAMAAANFMSIPAVDQTHNGLDLDLFATMIITITALMSMLVIVTTFAHRYYVTLKALEHSKQVIDNDRLFLESVLEAVSVPIFVKNRQHQFVMINEACCKLLRRPRAAVLGKTNEYLFPTSEADKYYEMDEKIFLTGQSEANEEEYITDDHETRHIQIRITPYFSAVGEPLLVGTVRDITYEKSTLVALEQARIAAEDTARMKTMFLANMSHEIRTPMSAIIGLLNLVLNKPLSAELRDYLEKIKTSSDSLLTILNDILDYSKVESGHMELDLHVFDIQEMLQNLRNLFAIRAEDKGLNLEITVNPLVPNLVIGDSLRIQQILTNLIGNAIKFTAKGKVALTISRVMRQDSQIKLGFKVEDSGIGMSENDKAQLFQAFNQVDNSITRRFGGTGLGLVISGNLLALMNSEFQVDSVIGQGSVFSFELMLGLPTLQETHVFKIQQKQRHTSAQSQLVSPQLFADTAILVVEDNVLNQQVAREFLELFGAKIYIAENGQEALQSLKTHTVAAILMDVHMPIMGGEEATKYIRNQPQFADLPIIALSAGVTKEERERCLASGMNDFVSKPIMPDELINVLIKWIKPAQQPAPFPATQTQSAPDTRALHLPGFELNNLLKMVNGNWQTVIKLLLKFKENHADTIDILVSQLNTSDYEQAQKTVHNIKGVSGNIGATALFELACQLEKECYLQNIQCTTLTAFSTEFNRVINEIATLNLQ